MRSLEYGPGVASHDDDTDLADVQVAYRFPTEYRISLEDWFHDSKLLVDLFSIATRVPLLSRTRYVRLASWIEEIDPNFASGTRLSGGYISDVWPQPCVLSKGDVDAFSKLARGWHTYPNRPDAMTLAVRRLAASLSHRGGRFGQQDRILDVAIALEVLYGGKTGHELAKRAAALLSASAEEQKQTYNQAKSFYKTRSTIVHSNTPAPAPDDLDKQLETGRDLACLTLANLLSRDALLQWAEVMKNLLPETQAHIEAVTSQQDR